MSDHNEDQRRGINTSIDDFDENLRSISEKLECVKSKLEFLYQKRKNLKRQLLETDEKIMGIQVKRMRIENKHPNTTIKMIEDDVYSLFNEKKQQLDSLYEKEKKAREEHVRCACSRLEILRKKLRNNEGCDVGLGSREKGLQDYDLMDDSPEVCESDKIPSKDSTLSGMPGDKESAEEGSDKVMIVGKTSRDNVSKVFHPTGDALQKKTDEESCGLADIGETLDRSEKYNEKTDASMVGEMFECHTSDSQDDKTD